MDAKWLPLTPALDRAVGAIEHHGKDARTISCVSNSLAAIGSSRALLAQAPLGTRLPGFECQQRGSPAWASRSYR